MLKNNQSSAQSNLAVVVPITGLPTGVTLDSNGTPSAGAGSTRVIVIVGLPAAATQASAGHRSKLPPPSTSIA